SISTDTNSYWELEAKDYEYQADTTELVDEDGKFEMEMDHHGIEGKETTVAVRLDFDGQQDDDVIRHYGDRGQNLEGPYIYQHRGESGGTDPKITLKMEKYKKFLRTKVKKLCVKF